MHTVVRRYDGATALFDELAKRENDVRDIITTVPGFITYSLVRTSDGGFSITTCENETGTTESSRRAGQWIKDNLPNLASVTPTITEGDVLFRFVDPAAARAVLSEMGVTAG